MTPIVEWAIAREALRKKKELGGPPPWTDDAILNEYRFCNVRRRDDKASQWLRQNVVNGDQLNRVGIQSFLTFTAFCRWNNWPPMIAEVLPYWGYYIDWEEIVFRVENRVKRGEKAWTGAYMIRGPIQNAELTKSQYVVNVCRQLEQCITPLTNAFQEGSRQKAWEVLTDLYSWGSFMAGQVVDDWTWTILLGKAKDMNTWAPQGPGSLRGLNRICDLPLNNKWDQDAWCVKLIALRSLVCIQLEKEFGRSYRDLTLMDIQNCLCETDKWLRVRYGEGKPRSRYKPEEAYNV